MKLAIVGLGQCGCNIADIFYDVSDYSQSIFNRRINIVTDTFAINTDETDLGGFKHIPRDKGHRILIGNLSTYGHGVGKINTDAASIIKSVNSVVIDTVLRSPRFHESDAVLVIASSGGGTGSGTIGWTIREIKARTDKPVYALLVLPFAFEERGDTSFAVLNSATSLNTVNKYADAVFLFDNENHRTVASNLARNFQDINEEIAMNFYDLCCAGEEKKQRYVGNKVVDAGDIKQSLSGFSAIGRGEMSLPILRLGRNSYRQGIKESSMVFSALRQAETNLGLGIELEHARRVLVLITSPKDCLSTGVMEEIFAYLDQKAPKAQIRIGDYPRRDREISVTLVVSELVRIGRLERLFMQAESLMKKREEIRRETDNEKYIMREFSRNIPTLD